ncbi:MAG: class I SAM-dependent RNA methyltransferase, partial [Alphaproteobacteria bacterium]
FALVVAETAMVEAVEGARDPLSALAAARGSASGLKPIVTVHRDLFRHPLQADELARFDAVICDPPRAGARAQSAALATAGVPVVMMVSCNPNSFARDARILADGGYRLDWVRPIGQFLWSRHVELVARFTR